LSLPSRSRIARQTSALSYTIQGCLYVYTR
jgi:hypothetical protein